MLFLSTLRFFTSRGRVCSIALGLLIHLLLSGERLAIAAEPDDREPDVWTQDELDRHLALEWEAPAECPKGLDVRERVRSLLRAKGEPRRRFHARATVTAVPAGYSLDLAVDDGPSRTLSSETCVGLAEATALILAVDIEGHFAEPRAPVSIRAKPAPTAKKSGATPKQPHPLRVRPAFGARVVVDAGSLPQVTSGYRATFLLAYGLWRAEAAATSFVPRAAEGPRDGTGAHLDLVTGGLRVCRSSLVDRGDVAFGACLGGEAGRFGVAGFGITRPSSSAGLWTSVVAAPELRLAWNRSLPVIIGLEIGAALTRAQAVVGGIGPIFDPDPWFFRGTVGLEFDFFRTRG